jgi:hypothetical protein
MQLSGPYTWISKGKELTLVNSMHQLSTAGGGAGVGVCLLTSSGDKALTTMLILGRNSASYCTHKAATAASCIGTKQWYDRMRKCGKGTEY